MLVCLESHFQWLKCYLQIILLLEDINFINPYIYILWNASVENVLVGEQKTKLKPCHL